MKPGKSGIKLREKLVSKGVLVKDKNGVYLPNKMGSRKQ